MENIEKKYSNLQEITFWQQLNKQLIEKRRLGAPITDENHKALQKFCFDNQLFHKITEDPLIDELTLALMTDFDQINTLTFSGAEWIECLTLLLPNAIALDIEQAQADSFDVISELDRKYRFFEKAADDSDDDEELYAFIEKYNALVEEQERQLSDMLRFMYQKKALAVSKIYDEYDGRSLGVLEENAVLFDFQRSGDRDRIISIYHHDFCEEALAKISKFGSAESVISDWELLWHLDESAPDLKTSIREFIEHERELVIRQSKLMEEFYVKLEKELDGTGSDHIKIADLAPFAFLKSPFPAV